MLTTRRDILRAGITGALGSVFPSSILLSADETLSVRPKLPVAAVVSVYTPNSHADVIVGKILEGYQQDGGVGPDLKIVSLYTDQVPQRDLSRVKAEKHGFRISPTIRDALTLASDQVQVAGVLCIGEHGDYPKTDDTDQRMYPRRQFFDEVIKVFKDCQKVVPLFNDKHLGYQWEDAREMVETAREMKIPFLAGSSLPVAWRMPPVELPRGCEIESAVTIGYGGFEDYGFHALEAHQCLLERRRGGETGIAAIRTVRGDLIRMAELAGDWSSDLFAAARRCQPGTPDDSWTWTPGMNSAAYLLEHNDGLRSAVIMANGLTQHFSSAIRIKGQTEPVATWFRLQEGPPYGHFAFLVRAIEETIHSGQAAYPVERTLLTTGILDRVMHSLASGSTRYETPELGITYSPSDWPYANHGDSPLHLPYE
jgi:hypothetical protein